MRPRMETNMTYDTVDAYKWIDFIVSLALRSYVEPNTRSTTDLPTGSWT